jgi:hypothetical protein
MESVVLELPKDAANRFLSLSSMDKNRLYSLIVSWLVSPNIEEKKRIESKFRLLKLMNEVGQEAVSNGITEDILNDILNES